ncbi:hypothetical protein [Parafilimonas sp.]|uniref:hypothetical protein n=1 Tax=Parafilimonas sp. TaxID=1969739 RepID=UPI003F7FB3BF
MEPGIKEFFKRLAASMAVFILWIAINMTIGIKYEYALFSNGIGVGNIIFYVWLILSFIALVIFYIKLWKKPIENLHDNP